MSSCLGAVAQLERALIAERTKAGLRSARSRGPHRFGSRREPRHPKAGLGAFAARWVTRCASGRGGRRDVLRHGRCGPCEWHPGCRRVARIAADPSKWTAERLRRTVRRRVAERIVEPGLLGRAPRQSEPCSRSRLSSRPCANARHAAAHAGIRHQCETCRCRRNAED